jgi:hypothetical protein
MSFARGSGTLTHVESRRAPPELAFALAASVAWHTRRPTLLVRISSDEHTELAEPERNDAHLLVSPPTGRFAPEQLPHTLDDLRRRYEHVLAHHADQRAAHRAAGSHRRGSSDAPVLTLPDGPIWFPTTGPDADGILHVPPLRDVTTTLANAGLPAPTRRGAHQLAARHLTRLKIGLARRRRPQGLRSPGRPARPERA